MTFFISGLSNFGKERVRLIVSFKIHQSKSHITLVLGDLHIFGIGEKKLKEKCSRIQEETNY